MIATGAGLPTVDYKDIELFNDSLERTLHLEEFDPQFDARTGTARRHVLQPGIDFIKSRY